MKFSLFKKSIVSIGAIFLSMIPLSACGTMILDGDNSALGLVQQYRTTGESSNDPFGKYEPEIDISFVRSIDNDLAVNILPKTPGETMEDNRWIKLYKEQLGINVKYDWIVKDTEYYNKINVTLASGDLPDVVNVDSSQLKQLAQSGMIEDMTEYYDEYASPLTKEIYLQEGKAVLNSADIDGKLMAIPNVESSMESAQFLWIRTDWMKKLGLEPPKTMEDLMKISEAFTSKDPDGNGKADTFGLAVTKNLYGPCMGLEGFFAGFHAYPNFWLQDSSGKLVYGSVLPETKTALQKLAQMYKAGQLDAEFGVKDAGKVADSIVEGKVGIEFGEQWNPMYPLISSFKEDGNADWTGYPIVSADDKPLKVPLKFRTHRYFAVRKGYKHPEALVKLVNMHLEKNWGETNEFGRYYMPVENDSVGVWKFSPVTPYPPYKNMSAYLKIDEARQSGDMSTLKGEPQFIQFNIQSYAMGDKSQWGWEKIYGVNGVFDVLRRYRVDNSLMTEGFAGAPTKTMAERKGALDKYEKEVFTKIIMGSTTIDEFEKFTINWNKLGGEAITKEVNDWYNSLKK